MKTNRNKQAGTNTPPTNAKKDRELAEWVADQRKAYKENRLSPEQISALEMFPGWKW